MSPTLQKPQTDTKPSKRLAKTRLDKLLVEGQLCETRSQAQGLILAGKVRVHGMVSDKPGTLFSPDILDAVTVEAALPYVSRGGLKLAKALDAFSITPQGKVCLDIGASTGGFTDCLLQNGAQQVYAIDVGYGQLDWKLRQDPRVISMEKTNIRYLSPDLLPTPASLAVADVSFISLAKVTPSICALLAADEPVVDMILLLKPQFEYKDYMADKGFDGVVRGAENHRLILEGVINSLETLLNEGCEGESDQQPRWQWVNATHSPIMGPKGNREFPLHFSRTSIQASPDSDLSSPSRLTHRQRLLDRVIEECYGDFKEN